jgi:glycosyltransferase involved in cell wall biosynthesis
MSERGRAPAAAGRAGCSLAVDARALRASGLGRYLREVLAAVLADQRFGRVVLLGEPRELEEFLSELPEASPGVELRPYRGDIYSARSQAEWLALRAGGLRTDVTFFPHFDTPQLGLAPRSVITVHDLTPIRVREGFSPARRLAAGVLIRRALSRAERVITGSEHARRDLESFLPEARGKIEVIPHGAVSGSVRAGVEEEACAETLRPYLLCVGNRKPHKNLLAAVETLARLRVERPELRLVFAGRVYPGWEEVRRRARELGVEGALVDLGEVTDAMLAALYRGCEAFLFPSLYEGFGLPVLEAMHHGAPVVTSDRASLLEVAGGAAVALDPFDHAGMADAVRRLLDDASFRRDLVRRGRDQAARYSWQRAAQRTADVLYRTASPAASAARELSRALG